VGTKQLVLALIVGRHKHRRRRHQAAAPAAAWPSRVWTLSLSVPGFSQQKYCDTWEGQASSARQPSGQSDHQYCRFSRSRPRALLRSVEPSHPRSSCTPARVLAAAGASAMPSTCALKLTCRALACVSIRHTSAYASIRLHTSAYVSIACL